MSLLRYKAVQSILASLLLALVSGIISWFVTTDRKVSALEIQQVAIHDDVKVIREDVRELRKAFIGPPDR